jgi:predicted anti-sigma-YlaC factor YlaD
MLGSGLDGPSIRMSKQTRWLLSEIERWTADAIISQEQADRLRQRYTIPLDGPPWGLLVFASAGALVIGLGVILLFAYNWNAMPKFGKLALVLTAVISVHAGGLVLYRKAGWQRRLGEAFSLLGTMLYGAGIWLVAQIYHIDEHYPNGFLLWALGALALAWILDSIPHALLATVLLSIWGGSEVFHFHNPNDWALVLVAVGLLPLCWRRQSALLLAFVLAALELLLIANVLDYGGGARAFASSLALGVLLVGAARLTAIWRPSFSAGANVMAFFGFGGFFVCSYLLAFHDAADDLLNWARRPGPRAGLAAFHSWAVFVLAASAWVSIAWQSIVRQVHVAVEEWLLPIALLYAHGLAALGMGTSDYALFISLTFNVVLLGFSAMWMWRGCSESRLRPTVMGSLLLAAVVLARYFDLFDSLAARGFAFILLGGFFMAEAMYYRRIRRAESPAPGVAS